MAGYDSDDLSCFADKINGLPRKILGYATPEVTGVSVQTGSSWTGLVSVKWGFTVSWYFRRNMLFPHGPGFDRRRWLLLIIQGIKYKEQRQNEK